MKPLINDHNDVLRMVEEVGSPHLKVCLDAPLLPDRSTEAIRKTAQAVGRLQVLSHFGGEFDAPLLARGCRVPRNGALPPSLHPQG